MIRRVSTYALDELDLMLIDKLEDDARKSYMDLATELSTSRATVRRKIQRLLKEGAIELYTLVSPIALGYRIAASFGINTSPGKADIVGDQLASLEDVRNVVLATGRYDIFIWTVFPDNEHMLHFLSQRLGKVSGVVNIETFLTIRNIRHYWQNGWKIAMQDDTSPGQQHKRYAIGETDSLILRELELDPRATTVAIGRKLGISQSSVHKRLQLLLDKKIVRFRGIADQSALGYNIRALIFVKVNPSEVYTVAEHVLTLPAIRSASITTGSFLLCLWGRFRDSDDLHAFLTGELGVIPGVLSHETSIITKVVRRSFFTV